MAGKAILHYIIMKEFGRIRMGVVYLARCTKLKRDVAFLLMGKKIEAIKLFDQAISLESG